jgi:arylsulfatase A-like enzyme
MIKQLDDNIGILLAELNRMDLTSNTLVIFLSDNGGASYTLTTDNGPLRAGKISDFEGGLRVPFFMRMPENIRAGQQYDQPVIAMDVFSTVAAAAGCPLPDDRKIDGRDLISFITADSTPPHPNLYWQRGNSKAIRAGEWKVIWNEDSGDTLMYDLVADPYEKNDLFGHHKSLARQLTLVHGEWSGQLPPPLWPSIVRFREDVEGRSFYFEN